MYRVNHNTAPSYLSELRVYTVVTLVSDRPLGETTLSLEHTVRSLMQHRLLGTLLPDNVRDSESYSNFLSKLKTHYFNIAFYNHIIC